MIVIVDYGLGNLHSIKSKIAKLHYEVQVSRAVDDIRKADKLILPGVGYFAEGMKNLRAYGLTEVLAEAVLGAKTPFLGICLGMQLLTERGEEGDAEGLGWIKGATKRLDVSRMAEPLRIPHVGWNTIKIKRASILLNDVPSDSRFYFTHSYAVDCEEQYAIATTDYGYEFPTIVEVRNIYGTQFHPEKSHAHGLRLIENFLRHGA